MSVYIIVFVLHRLHKLTQIKNNMQFVFFIIPCYIHIVSRSLVQCHKNLISISYFARLHNAAQINLTQDQIVAFTFSFSQMVLMFRFAMMSLQQESGQELEYLQDQAFCFHWSLLLSFSGEYVIKGDKTIPWSHY